MMKRQRYGVWLAGLLWCGQSLADVPITIRGTILEPVCTVTGEGGGSTVEVNFDDVSLDDVGTAATERPINLTVSCDNPAPDGKALRMYVHPTRNGILRAVGPNVLGTSRRGLGIALTTGADGTTPVDLDSWVPVGGVNTDDDAPAGQVAMKARLVTPSAGTLQAGAFNATVNLVMSYR